MRGYEILYQSMENTAAVSLKKGSLHTINNKPHKFFFSKSINPFMNLSLPKNPAKDQHASSSMANASNPSPAHQNAANSTPHWAGDDTHPSPLPQHSPKTDANPNESAAWHALTSSYAARSPAPISDPIPVHLDRNRRTKPCHKYVPLPPRWGILPRITAM